MQRGVCAPGPGKNPAATRCCTAALSAAAGIDRFSGIISAPHSTFSFFLYFSLGCFVHLIVRRARVLVHVSFLIQMYHIHRYVTV